MSLRRKIFYSFVLAMVTLVLVLPMTGWLARLQLLPFLSLPMRRLFVQEWRGGSRSASTRYQEIARREANDWEIQFAYAMMGSNHDEQIQRLEVIHKTYPGNPVILSSLLREMTAEQVAVRRVETNLLREPRYRTAKKVEKAESDPATLAKFIAMAEAGEKAKPENGYFPMMAALGYFAAHRDEEATNAWKRASEKQEWDDYTSEEVTAKWKLHQAVNGGNKTGAIPRMATAAAVLYPHYAMMREGARMVAVQAVFAEQQGDSETGLALRRATRRNGQLVQHNGKNAIAVFVGRAIVGLSGTRAGGAEVEPNPFQGKDAAKRWSAAKVERYKNYLVGINHPEEATALTATMAQGETIQNIWRTGHKQTYFGFGAKTTRYFASWVCDAFLLIGILFALTFAAIFKLVYRFSPRLQQGEPLQASAKWGVTVGIILPLIIGAAVCGATADTMPVVAIFIGALSIVSFILVVPPVLLRFSAPQLWHGLRVAFFAVMGLLGLVAAGATALLLFGMVMQSFAMMSSGSDASHQGQLTMVAAFGAVLLVPLSMIGIFGVLCRFWRIPFAAGVVRGMRATAVPLAATLLLIWCSAVTYTAWQEQEAIDELQKIVTRGEIQAIAEITHQAFPQ